MSPQARKGLGLSAALVAAWLGSFALCLSFNSAQLPWWALIAAVLIRAQLQTGLFIIGHDAMHGLLWPTQRRLNADLGALMLLLYAALPYGHCCANHRRHHRAPASARDPDCPAGTASGALTWYRQFMAGYLNARQMTVLLSGWAVLAALFARLTPTAGLNVLLFGTLPLLLSSLQLFVVGTYLPHRGQGHRDGPEQPHSLDLPAWLSLLACFHFGYHREHHDHPDLPWFALPTARQNATVLALP
ncbi:MAG: beta-carotene ketolase [Cyanobacteria bacterium K_DeepCast_35m_m2_023]|nr:beta-carotene ketolase [Cyanobacteria bacterium K_DeepCast_35m_m2_023]